MVFVSVVVPDSQLSKGVPHAELEAPRARLDRACRFAEIRVRIREQRDVAVVTAEVRAVEHVEAFEGDGGLLASGQTDDFFDPEIDAFVVERIRRPAGVQQDLPPVDVRPA